MLCRAQFYILLGIGFSVALDTETTRSEYEKRATRPTADPNPGLILTRQFFKNISKQLQESIQTNELANNIDRKEDFFETIPSYHHHEHHWGPFFESETGGKRQPSEGTQQLTAHVGSEALLHCRVGMLKDKTVMWLRRTPEAVQLLTVGKAPYAADNRISIKFQYPNNWRLSINPTRKDDTGLYMCQISTHPPRATLANLTVLPPLLTINGDAEHEIKDRIYNVGSKIELQCDISLQYIDKLTVISKTTVVPTVAVKASTLEITTVPSTTTNRNLFIANKSWSVEAPVTTTAVPLTLIDHKSTTVRSTVLTTVVDLADVVNNVYGLIWRKNNVTLVDGVDYDNPSGIKYKVKSATQNDSGMYVCSVSKGLSVAFNVHVVFGENQAAVHHDSLNRSGLPKSQLLGLFAVCYALSLL